MTRTQIDTETKAKIEAIRAYVMKRQNAPGYVPDGQMVSDYELHPISIIWNKNGLNIVTAMMYYDLLYKLFDGYGDVPYAVQRKRQYAHNLNTLKVAYYEKRFRHD